MRNLLILFVGLVLFGSCATERNATKYYKKNPLELAKICADTYPPKIEYRPGKPIVQTDTTVVRDSVVVEIEVDCPDGSTVVADCPPAEKVYINRETLIRDTVSVENTANVEYLEGMLKQSEIDLILEKRKSQDLAEKARSRLYWSLILGVLVAGRALWSLRNILGGV